MKQLIVIFFSLVLLASCQNKDEAAPTSETGHPDITADVLAKISSKFEYRSRQNVLSISSSGTYRLTFDALVQKNEATIKSISRNEARCILNFSGKISFHKSSGHIPATALLTQARMTLTGTSLVKGEATASTVAGTDPHEFCLAYQFAASDEGSFENHVLSYDEMSVLFTGLYFNVKDKSAKSAESKSFLYIATLYNEDVAEHDIVRMDLAYTYFIKTDGDVDITEMAFTDLQGVMKSVKGQTPGLSAVEVEIGKVNELKTVTIKQRECELNYSFFILNVRAKAPGIYMKLLADKNSVPAELSPDCVLINENVKRLGGETKISYANQTRVTTDPDNYLRFYIKQADGSFVTWAFSSQ